MPKVYSWSDVRKDRIATPKRIEKAKREGLVLLRKLYKRGWIVSAGLFGSTARRDHFFGSDLDAIVISKPEFEGHVRRVLERSFKASMETLFVEPEVIHINARDAREGTHSIRMMYGHIKENLRKGSTVGKPLTSVLRMSRQNVLQISRVNFEQLATSISKQAMSRSFLKSRNDPQYYNILEQAVARTLNCARHTLDSMNKLPKRGGRTDDSKATVMRIYSEVFAGRPKLVSALRNVFSARDAYFKALENASSVLKSGNQTKIRAAKRQYDAALRGIEKTLEGNILFFKENARIMRELEKKRARASRRRTGAKRLFRRKTHLR